MDQAIRSLLILEKLATGPGQGETCDGCGGTVTGAPILMEGTPHALGCGVRLRVDWFALRDAERQVPGHEPVGAA